MNQTQRRHIEEVMHRRITRFRSERLEAELRKISEGKVEPTIVPAEYEKYVTLHKRAVTSVERLNKKLKSLSPKSYQGNRYDYYNTPELVPLEKMEEDNQSSSEPRLAKQLLRSLKNYGPGSVIRDIRYLEPVRYPNLVALLEGDDRLTDFTQEDMVVAIHIGDGDGTDLLAQLTAQLEALA